MDSTHHLPNQEQQEEPFWGALEMRQVDGFWYAVKSMGSVNAFRAHFQPGRDDVVILASARKTGTTWLKALAHSIVFRDEEGEEEEDDLLAVTNPHGCVPTFETALYLGDESVPRIDPDRRLFHTHVPYSFLPDSIRNNPNGCKLVYITRSPKDTLVSQWHFYNKIFIPPSDPPFPLDRAVDSFCTGMMPFGPYWDHVLEYWEASKQSPDKVMFFKYEDLRRDPKLHVRELASFLGKPFGEDGEVEKVIWRSSFDRLKELEVNKTGRPAQARSGTLIRNSHFFRRGEVGDWRNYLTSEMARRVDDITRVKFRGTGLEMDDAC